MLSLRINGEVRDIDAPPNMPLLWVLRDILGLTGTKFECGIAQCGACTVHVDGTAALYGKITIDKGRVQQSNFAATGIRLRRLPIDRDVLSGKKPS